jgi:hypothetical protein
MADTSETITVYSASWEIVYPSGGCDADGLGDFLTMAEARRAIAEAVSAWDDECGGDTLRFWIDRDEWTAEDAAELNRDR